MDVKTKTRNVFGTHELSEDLHMKFEYKSITLSCVCSDQGHLEVQNISKFSSLLTISSSSHSSLIQTLQPLS